MQKSEVLKKLLSVKSWQSGDKRAPHKPLLMLYALARLRQGYARITFEETEPVLRGLIAAYGPSGKGRSEYPFVRLCNDGIWYVEGDAGSINTRKDYSPSSLKKLHATGGFQAEFITHLQDKDTSSELIRYLLETNFPESLHEDILNELGLDLNEDMLVSFKRKRDPNFRIKTLEAYRSSCAVCGYSIRSGDNLVGIEAAHIKWHQAGGPDEPVNGVALCSLHHKLYDRGLFLFESDFVLRVSPQANGPGIDFWLKQFEDRPISRPITEKLYPQKEFIDWHFREVFKKGYNTE